MLNSNDNVNKEQIHNRQTYRQHDYRMDAHWLHDYSPKEIMFPPKLFRSIDGRTCEKLELQRSFATKNYSLHTYSIIIEKKNRSVII